MRFLPLISFLLLLFWHSEVSSQSCLPEGITFTTQSQIDSFQINYPGCTEIEGKVYIESDNITNLNGLFSLESVDESFLIVHNPNLGSLWGLDSLSYIGGNLTIFDNGSLVDVDGLNNLNYVGESLAINSNPILKNLSGFSNLNSSGIGIYISSNDVLQDLQGLEGISSTETLSIISNNSLVGLSGLENLAVVQGSLCIANNVSLINLEGLESLNVIEGSLSLIGAGFSNLSGLENLSYVGLVVKLENLDNLQNLNGLESIEYIGLYLTIKQCNSLITLSGLDSLSLIGGKLEIIENNLLQSLSGIDNINPQSITTLSINYNPQLTTCEVQSICAYLASPNGTIEIFDNATGCNSQAEVEEACTVGISEQQSASQLSAYPNPFTTTTTIEYKLSEPSHVQLIIYNAIGEMIHMAEDRMMPVGKHSFTWTADRLPEGLYYAVLRSEEGVAVVKMVKQR